MDTYFGRLMHFFDLTDLRNAFLSEKDVNEAKALLAAHAAKTLSPSVTNDQLWDAKKSSFTVGSEQNLFLTFFLSSDLPSAASLLHFPSLAPRG